MQEEGETFPPSVFSSSKVGISAKLFSWGKHVGEKGRTGIRGDREEREGEKGTEASKEDDCPPVHPSLLWAGE